MIPFYTETVTTVTPGTLSCCCPAVACTVVAEAAAAAAAAAAVPYPSPPRTSRDGAVCFCCAALAAARAHRAGRCGRSDVHARRRVPAHARLAAGARAACGVRAMLYLICVSWTSQGERSELAVAPYTSCPPGRTARCKCARAMLRTCLCPPGVCVARSPCSRAPHARARSRRAWRMCGASTSCTGT